MFHKIYNYVFAHRGFHLKYPENTLEAYGQAVDQGFSIEIDIRLLKCGNIICFHDRYMKRLLSVPGRISMRTYGEIKDYKVLKSEYGVPTLKEVLKLVSGRVAILIEVKGLMSETFEDELKNLLKDYKGEVFFHCRNFLTYLRCKKVWDKDVFFVFNLFRKRFEFVKGMHYKNIHPVPTIDDIIVEAEDNAKTVIRKIWYTFNRYTTRVQNDHFLLGYNEKKYQIQHRAISDKSLKEHSREAFEDCVKNNKVIELDAVEFGKNIICYHDDTMSKKLGQKTSISEKLKVKETLTFTESLKIIDGRVPIVIDVKFSGVSPSKFIDKIMKSLKHYKGKYVMQSFNPLVLRYLYKNYPDVVRGQIGHSLNGLKKTRNIALIIVNFCLFYYGRPDYVLYDLDPFVRLLSKFNNILGLPVIGYAATCLAEIRKYEEMFDNIIVEGKYEEMVEGYAA